MSHVATVEIEIKSLEALAKACEDCGLELVQGQETYRWYGQWVDDYNGADAAHRHGMNTKDYGKCEHAIRVRGNPNAYEIGVVRNGEGFQLVWDFWGSEGAALLACAGDECKNVTDAYAYQVTKQTVDVEAKKYGFTVEEEVNAEGEIVFVMSDQSDFSTGSGW